MIWQDVEPDILMRVPVQDGDAALNDAIAKACELDIDQYVDVIVMIAPKFKEFLAGPMLTEDEEQALESDNMRKEAAASQK